MAQEEMQKEIHFHKDGKDFPIEEFNYYGYYHVNHISTMEAIKNGDDLIITTALTALNFHSLLDKDYKIFLHENGRVGEVYEGVTELTDKELRKGHDIARIWIGGGFYDYFYKTL